MKSKIYFILAGLFLTINLWAQNFSNMTISVWENNNWIDTARITNTYDNNGNVIKSAMDIRNISNSGWTNFSLATHELNANSTINNTITQLWNDDTKQLENATKHIFTYDDSKRILTQKMQMWMDPDWMDYYLTTNTYNGSGQILKELVQMYSFFPAGWSNSSQTDYTYNPDGTEHQSISQNWNIGESKWENSQRFTSFYNDAKQVTSGLTEDFSTGSWVNNYQTIMTYNADGSMKEMLSQNWNSSGSNWIDDEMDTYSYTDKDHISQIITTKWLADQTKWENQLKTVFTYTNTGIGNKLAGDKILVVFPNPFSDVISFKTSALNKPELQIYNSTGQLIRTIKWGENFSNINLSDLKNGLYLIKVVSPESQQVIKLIKAR
jgi:hypothetical protein